MNNYAIITGSAAGLGKAYAYELAKKGFHTILIDLPNNGLKSLSDAIKKEYQKECIFYETDLTKIENIIEITDDINKKYAVSLLVNNVGKGGTCSFDDADTNYLNTMIQLNVMATTIMTKQILPNLLKQKKSFILNVASLAAFSPFPFKTVYPASKAFIYSFSKGLREEYKNTNLFIGVVNPGPMDTNDEIIKRNKKQGILVRIGLQAPEKVAEKSIRQLLKKERIIFLNISNGFSLFLMKIIPTRFRLPMMTRVIKRELKENN